MLPRVKIFFENGALRASLPMPDGLCGVVCTGVTVSGTFVLGTPYILKGLRSLTDLGITVDNNPEIYKIVNEFYNEAVENVQLWLMGVADTVKLSEMADIANEYGKKMAIAAKGELRVLGFSRKPGVGYTPTIVDALDSDVMVAANKAQALGEYMAVNRYAPLFSIVEGAGFSNNVVQLPSVNQLTYNRVGVLLGDTVSNSKKATIGTVLGRIAVSPVQRNIARVKDGAVAPVATFIGDKATEVADFETVNDKGFITFRTHVNYGGYYFNDDFLAAKVADDYSQITRRRTIDKAYRIAYTTLVNELNEEVPINEDGTIPETFIKSWQAMVEGDIARQMSANGELSANLKEGDRGVRCYIDPNQNVASTSKIIVQIRVRPFGYARFIDVELGFTALAS